MKARFRTAVWMAVLAVFAAVLPASADTNGVAVVNGFASVGKWFVDDCDKSGFATVTGRGLYFPGTQTWLGVSNGADTREENGVWEFTTVGVAEPQGVFFLSTCGWLGSLMDIDHDRATLVGVGGATCGNSKGHHGQGVLDFDDAPWDDLKIYDLGWKISAGGLLFVFARYQEHVSGLKEEKYGVLLALLEAQGGDDCLGLKMSGTNNGNGAQSFSVVGVIELLNTNGSEPPDPKEQLPDTPEEKKCKGSGPHANKDGFKETHENKPAHDSECYGGDK